MQAHNSQKCSARPYLRPWNGPSTGFRAMASFLVFYGVHTTATGPNTYRSVTSWTAVGPQHFPRNCPHTCPGEQTTATMGPKGTPTSQMRRIQMASLPA
eukprot:scaffold563_cov410-Prasinococcus_capsulatus_cf.AAC.2